MSACETMRRVVCAAAGPAPRLVPRPAIAAKPIAAALRASHFRT